MFLKKKEDLNPKEEDGWVKKASIPKNSDFKDLKPENKRKRKEPIKPWGKGERVLILVFMLVTVGLSAYFAMSARDWKLPNMPRLISPDINPFKADTITIEGNDLDRKSADKAVSEFKDQTYKLTGTYGLYVVRLESGYSYGVYQDEVFQAASLIKLPIMVGMYMEAEKGNLDLDAKYTLKNSDKVGGSGSLYSKPEGTVLSYRDLIRYMCKESDNTAFNISVHKLGDEEIGKIITSIGMKHTSLDTNSTSPADIGLLYQRLWNGELIGSKDKEELLNFLTNTIYENWITPGIPSDVRVAHKYGREVKVVNDAGIIYSKNPFVLVILTKGVIESQADQMFPSLAQSIFQVESE